MKKIPSLYARDPEDMAHVTQELNDRCRWVIEDADHCEATIKYDGTCVMLDAAGRWWARHQVRPDKTAPPNYVPVETDPVTGKTQGWIPMEQSQYQKFHAAAVELHDGREFRGPERNREQWERDHPFRPGTFELIGSRIGKNPHQLDGYMLLPHGCTPLANVPTAYDELAEYLRAEQRTWEYLEGIVWHHDDGRMAKIKTKDFR